MRLSARERLPAFLDIAYTTRGTKMPRPARTESNGQGLLRGLRYMNRAKNHRLGTPLSECRHACGTRQRSWRVHAGALQLVQILFT